MTPGARVQATIELIEDVAQGGAADAAASAYFRSRRYIGSKDRAAIAAALYALLRAKARLDWWLARAGARQGTGRLRVLAALALIDGLDVRQIAEAFGGGPYAPAPLTAEERAIGTALAGHTLDHPEQPAWVRGEFPAWLEPELGALDTGDLRALN